MNDSLPTSTDTGHDSPPTFSVSEVASMLGLSKDAVRARLHRGTLEGVKVEGAWRVRLPDDVSLISVMSEDRQGPTPDATAPTPSATSTPTPPPSDIMVAHLEHLEGEVQYLREQLAGALEQLADERRRVDVMRLSASVSAPDESPIETYRAAAQTPSAGPLARLRRWLTGNT